MTWRSILISKPAKLSLHKGQLLIQQDEKYTVSLEDIVVIVVEVTEVTITVPLLSTLAIKGVSLLTCDEQFLPCGQWLPFAQYHRSLKVLKLQIGQSISQKKQLHQAIVRQKICNQAQVLELSGHTKNAKYLYAIAHEVKSGDKENSEAYAASVYFPTLFGVMFTRRNENPINVALNYGYTIIRSAIARGLVQYGFNPALGLFHKSELNAFNLADDLIEPYRPLVDLYIWKLFVNTGLSDNLSPFLKQGLIRLLHHQIKINNEIHSVLSAIDKTAGSLQNSLSNRNPLDLKLPSILPLKEHLYE